MTTAPTIIEKLFVEIFDRKKRIIEKLNDQKQLYNRHLASKLLIQGITPPPWLLKSSVTTHDPCSSDLGEFNKEELISGLLFPHQHPTVPHQNSSCFFYPRTASSLADQELPVDFYNGASASSKCFHETRPIIPTHCIGHTLNNDSPASPQDPTDLRVPDICYEADQSLARIQRSRSRQKALELRNSAKASDKCRLAQESSLGLCFDDVACQLHDERFNEFSELDKPAASFSGTCRADIGDFSNKENQVVGDSISTSMGDKCQPNTGDHHNNNNKSKVFSDRMGRSRSNLQKSLVVNGQINQGLNKVHSLPRSIDDEVQADTGGYDSKGIKISGHSGRIVSSRRHLQESSGIGGRSNLNEIYSTSISRGDEAQETQDHCRSNSYSGRITRSRSNLQASAGLSGKITHKLNEDYSITRSKGKKEAETGDYHRKEDENIGCSSTLIRSTSSLQQSADMVDKVNEEMTHAHCSRSVKYRASNSRQEETADCQLKEMDESLHSVTRDWCNKEVEGGYYHIIGGINGYSGILTGSRSSVLQSFDIINKINDEVIKAHNGRSVKARSSNAREEEAADCQHKEMGEILISVTRDCCNKEAERGDQHSIEDGGNGYSGRLTRSRSSLQQSADTIIKINEEVIETHRTRSVKSRASNARQEETTDHQQKEMGESHPNVINKEVETGNHHSIEHKSNGYCDRLTGSSSLLQSADIINKINEELIQAHCSRSVWSRTSNARQEETADHQQKEMGESLPSVTRDCFNKETEREYHHSIENVNNGYSGRLTRSRSSLQQSADIITNKINEEVIEAHSSRYVKNSTSSARQEETMDHLLKELDEILPSVSGDCCYKEAETGDHRSIEERSNGHSGRQTRSRITLQQSADIIGMIDNKSSEAYSSGSVRSKTSNARQEETTDHQHTEMGDSFHSVTKDCYSDAHNNRVYIGRNTAGEIEDSRSKGAGKSGQASRFSSCHSQPVTGIYDVSEVFSGRGARSRSCEARQGNSKVTRSCNDDVCASTDSVGNCGANKAENGNCLSMVNRIDIHGDSISRSWDYERLVKMGYCQEKGDREINYSGRMTRSRSNIEQPVDGNHHIKLLQYEANSGRTKFRRSCDAKEEETEAPHHKRRKTGYQLANSICSNLALKARCFQDTPNVSSDVSEDHFAFLQRHFGPNSSGAGQASPRNISTIEMHQKNVTGSSTVLPISTHKILYPKCEAILEHRRSGLIFPSDEHILVHPSRISSFISEMAVDPRSHFSEDEKLKADPAVAVVSIGMEDNGSFHSEDNSDDNASDKWASTRITSEKSCQEEELDRSVASCQIQVVDVGKNIEVFPVYGGLDVNEQRTPVVTHSQPNALLEHIDGPSTHAFNGSANSQRVVPEDSHAKRRKVEGLPSASKTVSPVLNDNYSQCATEDTSWSLTGVGDDSTHYQKQFTPCPRSGAIPLRPSCIVEMEKLLNSKGSMTMMLKPAAEIHYPEGVVDSSHMSRDAVPPTLEQENFQLPSMPCISQQKSFESQVQSSAGEGKAGTYPTNVAVSSHMRCDDLLLCEDKVKTAAEKMGTFDVNLLSRESLQKEAGLDCSVSGPDMQHVHVVGNEQSMPVFYRSFVDEQEDFSDFLHKPRKSTGLSTPFSQLPDLYKVQDAPDVSHSVPNGFLEHIEVRSTHSLYEHVDRQLKSSNVLLNDSTGSALGGKSYSDCLLFPSARFDWDFCKPYTSPPIGKEYDGITAGGSDKHGNSNPELTCFPIEEDIEISDEVLNSYEVAEMSGEDGSGVGKKIREPLRDATTRVKRESLKYVSTEISINETPKRANQNTGKQESRGRNKKLGKENCSSSLGVNSVNKHSASLKSGSNKPELLAKTSLNRRDQSSLEECKRINIVSDVKSFLSLVQRNQASALSGKRDVKVRALGAAEAAKRLAEKKENERKQKKALKLERAKIQQENWRQLELKKKLKEEEQKKKEVDAVARKRQKEEKEKKEKQRKRMRLEEARRQQREGPKVHAEKVLLRHGIAEYANVQVNNDSSGERENEENDFMKPAIGLGARGVVRCYDGQITMSDKMGPSPGSCNLGKVVDIDAVGTSIPIHDEKVNSVIQNVREQSYDISPYQCSEEEEEDDDDVPNGKFVPAWASTSCAALAISSEKQDPDLIFPSGSFCSLDKILMPRRLQKL